ncbi:hypothetical protein [Streptomyces sp. NBC_01294]|uniref:hypothetical protein n=1 Tax=Streptomyces sp. NBC_01294 TaxID=2903815 RepID=UPI002DD802B0|nr:hypothetical protein [Streptomyces sp. NBC_01294]WRZ55263.1 hypothetical protein OG534_01455 [Streptomyces sp. NBC_01294]WRZ61433.1 hypothetical protein OG534_36045 [Streptomyces sp. NBC_01294]
MAPPPGSTDRSNRGPSGTARFPRGHIYFKDGGTRADQLEVEFTDIDYIEVSFRNASA